MGHYILKGVTDALFLDSSKLPQIELVIQDKCWGDTTGCIIYYSVVCCEGTSCPQKHTLRVFYILVRGCFSVCSYYYGCGRPRRVEQADASTHFFVCSQYVK